MSALVVDVSASHARAGVAPPPLQASWRKSWRARFSAGPRRVCTEDDPRSPDAVQELRTGAGSTGRRQRVVRLSTGVAACTLQDLARASAGASGPPETRARIFRSPDNSSMDWVEASERHEPRAKTTGSAARAASAGSLALPWPSWAPVPAACAQPTGPPHR